jgi:hypothetical protein
MIATAQVRRHVRRFVGLVSVGVLLMTPPLAVAKDPIGRELFSQKPSTQQLAPRAEAPQARFAVIRLSERWFASRLGGQVIEDSDVDQVILNTHVRGRARTTATPAMKLQDDPKRASLQIVFTGITHSKTVGRNGPAILHSRSQTRFTATKQIVFTPGEGFEAQPAHVEAKTETFTDDIQSTRGGWIGRLVVRRAWKKVAASKPLSTEIARQNATQRIAAAIDRKIDDLLVDWNRAADLRETLALLRNGDGSAGYCCCSTPHYVEFALPGNEQDGPVTASPPHLANLDAPIQIWIHRSLVPERLLSTVARIQATQSTAQDILTRLGRVVPVSLPWSPPDTSLVSGQTSCRKNAIEYQFVEDWTVVSLPGPLPTETDTRVAGVKYQQ